MDFAIWVPVFSELNICSRQRLLGIFEVNFGFLGDDFIFGSFWQLKNVSFFGWVDLSELKIISVLLS